MSRVVTSTLVARRFVKVAKKSEKNLTPLQLQKLAFYAHGWAFPILDRPLIHDRVEAWPYGPVFPELYVVLKKYGRDPVYDVPMGTRERVVNRVNEVNLNKKEKDLINNVYGTYGKYTGEDLIDKTHVIDGPWDNTSEGHEINYHLIRDYFMEKDKIRHQRMAEAEKAESL